MSYSGADELAARLLEQLESGDTLAQHGDLFFINRNGTTLPVDESLVFNLMSSL